jgi:hypothetical protein
VQKKNTQVKWLKNIIIWNVDWIVVWFTCLRKYFWEFYTENLETRTFISGHGVIG